MVICLLTVVTVVDCIVGQLQATPRGVHAQTNDDNSSISVLDFLGWREHTSNTSVIFPPSSFRHLNYVTFLWE
jgi:hypothetical protein